VLQEVPGFDGEKAKVVVERAKEHVASGKADTPVPESVTAPYQRAARPAKKTDAEAAEAMSPIEQKLRAELAQHEKDKANDKK